MLRRILLTIFIFLSMSFPVYGQGPPADVMQEAVAQKTQQEQADHALEKEKAAASKIGNISGGGLMENFRKGGVIMYFILACSVIGVYVTIERMFSLQRSRILPRKFINNVLSIVSSAPSRLGMTGKPSYASRSYPSAASGSEGYGYPAPPQAPQETETYNEAPASSPPQSSEPPVQPYNQQQDQQTSDYQGQETYDPQGQGESDVSSFLQEPSILESPKPGEGSQQESNTAPQPQQVDPLLKKDMDHLLNILNKGLGDLPPAGEVEEPPKDPLESGSSIPPEEDSSEPDQGDGSSGSGSPPMNMSCPAGASFVDDLPEQGGYGSSEKDVVEQIVDYCEGKNIPLARVIKAGLLVYDEGILSMKTAITNANIHEGAIMEKGVGILGVLANVAPLLGLLGTVTGMIKAFEMISVGGSGRPEIVASGIAEALTTTAAGLFVGIPLLLLFHWLQGKVETMVIDLQEFSVDVVEKLVREGK